MTEKKVRRVVFYVRESSMNLPKLEALKNQEQWCYETLNKNTEWIMVHEPYIDKGLSGTSVETRPAFQKMMKFAMDGGCDLIVTREVSRFARNTLDAIRYVRKLKEHHVYVFFVNENINSETADGEIMLTIMASIAQDESRKISKRVLSGQETSMKKGIIFGTGNILGYEKTENGYVINDDQAAVVRKIFDLYLSGLGITKIKHELESEGIPTAAGNTIWNVSSISRILKNITYTGSSVYKKTCTKDYLSHKRETNKNKNTYIYAADTHPAIISKNDFLNVQIKLASKKKDNIPLHQNEDIWTKLLVCGCCGKSFVRESPREGRQIGYYCRTRKDNGKNACESMYISKWKLYMIAELVLKQLQDYISASNNNKKETFYFNEKEKITGIDKLIEDLIIKRADGEITKEEFIKTKAVLEKQKTKNLQNNIKNNNKTDFIKFISYLKTEENNYLSDIYISSFISKITVFQSKIIIYLPRMENSLKDYKKFSQ